MGRALLRHGLDIFHNQSARRRCGKRPPLPSGRGGAWCRKWPMGSWGRSLRESGGGGGGGGNCLESRGRVAFWIHGGSPGVEVSGACSVPSRLPSLRLTAFQTPGMEWEENAALGEPARKRRSWLLDAPPPCRPLGSAGASGRFPGRLLWTPPHVRRLEAGARSPWSLNLCPFYLVSFLFLKIEVILGRLQGKY